MHGHGGSVKEGSPTTGDETSTYLPYVNPGLATVKAALHRRLLTRGRAARIILSIKLMVLLGKRPATALLVTPVLLLALVAACGDKGSVGDDESATQAAAAATPTPELIPAPPPEVERLKLPLEGPWRPFHSSERMNYREHPDFQLPDPADLPPREDVDGLEFQLPDEPECPEDWERLVRPVEGFQICYPPDWTIEVHGYVSRGADDRWYDVGIYRMDPSGLPLIHVSVYVTSPYSQPFMYVAECEQAYRVTLNGVPASICPNFPGQPPEAKIIAYHVRKGDKDYFLNVVPRLEYDASRQGYLTRWSREDEETAIGIVQTFLFIEVNVIP